eukprot:15458071-Alexandrium_andersonii.AAC.1
MPPRLLAPGVGPSGGPLPPPRGGRGSELSSSVGWCVGIQNNASRRALGAPMLAAEADQRPFLREGT